MNIEELEKLQTPCFILDQEVLADNLQTMRSAFEKRWSKTLISYSVKTNSLPWLLSFLKQQSVLAEVVSPDEYRLVKALGFSDGRIVLNGPYKDFGQVTAVLNGGGIVNIDTPHEVDWLCSHGKGKDWKVGIRINFDLEKACPGETLMGDEPGRFGLNTENETFATALEKLEYHEIKVIGLHTHFNTKTKSLKVYETLAGKVCEIADRYDLELKYVDIGGGYFGDKPGAPTYDDYIETIASKLSERFDPKTTALIFEPGTAMVASSFKYLCRVFDKKVHKDKTIVFTDGSFVHTDFQLHGRRYQFDILSKNQEKEIDPQEQIVSGFTCMEKDRILYIPQNQEKIEKGDYLVFHNAGAYTLNFVPLFIEFLPPVYVRNNENYFLVREKWTEKEYLAKNHYDLETE